MRRPTLGRNRYRVLALTLAGIGLLVSTSRVSAEDAEAPSKPQCAQFCVDFCCKLYGVPLSMANIMQLLPPKERGESMWEIKRTLEKIGLSTDGQRMDFDALMASSHPVIAYMSQNHFVLVEKADEQTVRLLDGHGRRTTVTAEAFRQGWDGKALVVHPPAEKETLPVFVKRSRRDPYLQFETLFLDMGEIPQGQESVTFEFPFRNLGGADLTIAKVHMKCSCTAETEFPEQPIGPGGRGRILIHYGTENRRGGFRHNLFVQSNDPKFPIIPMNIAGNCTQVLSIKPEWISLDVSREGRAAGECYIRYSGDAPLRLSEPEADIPGLSFAYQKISREMLPEMLGASRIYRMEDPQLYKLTATWDGSRGDPNAVEGRISIRTGLDKSPVIRIPVYLTHDQPVAAKPSLLFLGRIWPGKQISERIKLVAEDSVQFTVDSADMKDTGLDYRYDCRSPQQGWLMVQGKIAHDSSLMTGNDRSIVVLVAVSGEVGGRQLTLPVWALPTAQGPSATRSGPAREPTAVGKAVPQPSR